MKKVFILVCDWVYDLDPDMNVEVFDTKDKAVSAMRWGIDIWCNENKDTDWDFNEGEDHASFSEDGRWQENHIAWTIYEREIETGEFESVTFTRNDFEDAGIDTEKCDDAELQGLANNFGEFACEYLDWRDQLYCEAQHRGIPTKNEDDEGQDS